MKEIKQALQSIAKISPADMATTLTNLEKVLIEMNNDLLETQALALEGKMKMYETATPMNLDYDDAYNTALQQAVDYIRAQKITK